MIQLKFSRVFLASFLALGLGIPSPSAYAKIKNIIFDFGGVLIEIHHQRTANAFRELGAKDFTEFYSQNRQHDIFENFEAGKLDAQSFRDFAKEKLGISEVSNEEFDAAWNALIIGYLPEKMEFLRKIKDQYNIYLLSNTNGIHFDYFSDLYERQMGEPFSHFNQLFKKAYYAHLMQLKKPHPTIYETVLKENQLDPKETLYIDDTPAYERGGNAVGMHTFLLKPGQKLEVILERIRQLDEDEEVGAKSASVGLLAAGIGSRMRSELPKVLHQLQNKPMIHHMLSQVQAAAPQAPIALVVGHKSERVEASVRSEPSFQGMNLSFVFQAEQKGTGHATQCILQSPWGQEKTKNGSALLIMPGDLPLIPKTLVSEMLRPLKEGEALRLLTCVLDQPKGYGRIVRSEKGEVLRIVEEKDATDEQRKIKEVGLATYLFDSQFLEGALPLLTHQNAQGEIYLTDVIEIARKQNRKIDVLVWHNPDQVKNVNTPEELEEACQLMKPSENR